MVWGSKGRGQKMIVLERISLDVSLEGWLKIGCTESGVAALHEGSTSSQ